MRRGFRSLRTLRMGELPSEMNQVFLVNPHASSKVLQISREGLIGHADIQS